MNDTNTDLFSENKGEKFTIKEYLFKYISYWPLFLLCLLFCLAAGYLYSSYATLKYQASALILAKEDESSKTSRSSQDLVNSALNGEAKDNLDNEIQLLLSTGLLERVVIKNQFNISYFRQGKFKNTDLYLDAPFRLIPQNIKDSGNALKITIKKISNDGIRISYGPEKSTKYLYVKWNVPFKIFENEFILVPRGKLIEGDGNYFAVWSPIATTSEEILKKTKVGLLDKKTSIIQLSIKTENLKRGMDILDALGREFIQTDIDDKNAISQNTIRFIDDRLDIVSKELSGVEGNLESFQGNNDLINVTNQTSQSFENSNAVSKNLTDLNIQQGIVDMIGSYFNNPGNHDKLVPSNLGLNDATLTNLINHYNELELNREREAPLLGSNSIVLTDINNQIADVKGSILESLQNITKNLKLQQTALEQQNSQYTQFLSSLPHKERMMQEIKRKQSITEGLYLYLLQKREETAISASSANISIYKQIDPAKGWGPVEPNTVYVLGYSIVLGLLLPIGLIRLRFLLNDKIISRSDITSKLKLPVLGELSHISKKPKRGLAVMDRNLISEQFRNIRTNISFLQKPKERQVLLVTSSSISEGKSLISLNLAAVLAIPGKRVALLEFDLRSPSISGKIGVDGSKGLANYLMGESNNLFELYQVMENIPSLHIYPAGAVPNNPADVLINEKMPILFDLLRNRYDYVIVDTPPAGLVSDSFILGEYSDAVIYVIRMRQTLIKQLDYINDIYKAKKIKNVGIIINDVKTGRKHGYGYGYGKEYNYNFGVSKKRIFSRTIKPALT